MGLLDMLDKLAGTVAKETKVLKGEVRLHQGMKRDNPDIIDSLTLVSVSDETSRGTCGISLRKLGTLLAHDFVIEFEDQNHLEAFLRVALDYLDRKKAKELN